MSASKNTIAVFTSVPTRKEAIASGTLLPGMHVARTSATPDTVAAGAYATAKPVPLHIVEEDEMNGKEVTESYASGARVFFRTFLPGDFVMVLLKDGQKIAKGDYLTTANDGKWIKYASGEKILQALEAKDLSATANTTDDLILCEVC